MAGQRPLPPRPRFQPRPQNRIVTAAQFAKGFYVYANGRMMHVGYYKIAVTGDGNFIVEDPQWQDAFE